MIKIQKYSKEFLIKLYRDMLRIRFCEESFVEPLISGKILTPCHLYSGQEAIAVGVCASLIEEDYIFGNHRSHGHYLAKGGDMKMLVAEIFCKETGCSRGRGGSMHIIDVHKGILGAVPIVAGSISLATGAALASKMRGDRSVTVSFFGDGAAGEGVLYESLNFASLHKLPIIYVCENNLYSTHMPIRDCRTENNIFKSGIPFCVPGYRVDGNDVLKVYEITQKLTDLCRRGAGPFLIECITYRLRGHVGVDDNIQGTRTEIRPKEEVEKWKKKDPIRRFENLLLRHKIFTKTIIEKIRNDAEAEVKDAHVFAENSPFPLKKELTRYVYI